MLVFLENFAYVLNEWSLRFFIILRLLCKVFTYSTLIKIEKESANKIETSDSIFCSFPREKIPNYRLGVPEKNPLFSWSQKRIQLTLLLEKKNLSLSQFLKVTTNWETKSLHLHRAVAFHGDNFWEVKFLEEYYSIPIKHMWK